MHNSILQDSSKLRQLEEETQWIFESKASPEAFARLYDRYAPNIYRYLLSRLGNVSGAQDVTSKTFLHPYLEISLTTEMSLMMKRVISIWKMIKMKNLSSIQAFRVGDNL